MCLSYPSRKLICVLHREGYATMRIREMRFSVQLCDGHDLSVEGLWKSICDDYAMRDGLLWPHFVIRIFIPFYLEQKRILICDESSGGSNRTRHQIFFRVSLKRTVILVVPIPCSSSSSDLRCRILIVATYTIFRHRKSTEIRVPPPNPGSCNLSSTSSR
jgi:hypothetical protein